MVLELHPINWPNVSSEIFPYSGTIGISTPINGHDIEKHTLWETRLENGAERCAKHTKKGGSMKKE